MGTATVTSIYTLKSTVKYLFPRVFSMYNVQEVTVCLQSIKGGYTQSITQHVHSHQSQTQRHQSLMIRSGFSACTVTDQVLLVPKRLSSSNHASSFRLKVCNLIIVSVVLAGPAYNTDLIIMLMT